MTGHADVRAIGARDASGLREGSWCQNGDEGGMRIGFRIDAHEFFGGDADGGAKGHSHR